MRIKSGHALPARRSSLITCWPRANGTSDESTAIPRSAIVALNSSVSSAPNVCRNRIGVGAARSLPQAANAINQAIIRTAALYL